MRTLEMENKRICIIGCSGSGKSTLATELGKRTGIDVIYLDQNFWQPNWVEMENEQWDKTQREFCERETWIMDGTYMRTLDERLEAADAIVFLDLPTWTCLKRVIERTLSSFGKERLYMAKGCPERFSFAFLWYVFRFRKTHRGRVLNKLFDLDEDKRVYHLKAPQDVSIFAKTF